ncbi:MAG: hypothetical protein D6766_14165 [Verrucomicrobia bacterium]|nr:MAG: hypothetical protein D6766_14165 [Verrucomicrobiota bacterium]
MVWEQRLDTTPGFGDRCNCFNSLRQKVTRVIEKAGVPTKQWARVVLRCAPPLAFARAIARETARR